mgnify:CR=1 FL=1
MARFNNNMFQFEDFDMSGIMNPELADVIEMRKEANNARGKATDQYEADVADFKNTQATEAEQGIASLPNAPSMPNIPTVPNIDYTNFNPTLFGQPFITPDFNLEDMDFTNLPNIPTVVDNPYTEVFDTPTPESEPVVTLPDLGLYDYNNNVFEPEPTPYIDPYEQGDNYVTDDAIYNPTDDIIDVDIPTNDYTPPDYPFVDPETGGDYVLVVGDPTNPGPGVVVTDPVTGELPPGYVDQGEGTPGPAGTVVEPYIPPRDPSINIYTGRQVRNPYRPFEQPSSPVDDYIRPMDPAEFGRAPGMNQGGRVPMGNNNQLNSGLSRLPINLQNDTLTQVFQSGFRPRR